MFWKCWGKTLHLDAKSAGDDKLIFLTLFLNKRTMYFFKYGLTFQSEVRRQLCDAENELCSLYTRTLGIAFLSIPVLSCLRLMMPFYSRPICFVSGPHGYPV